MEKLDLTTPDFTNENIAKLAELFPNCVTEKKNDKGEVVHAIDFDALRQEFSDTIVEGTQERYNLNWPGKREALVTANTPISKTLRPCRNESVDFDNTKNIFIEGDNLDALKLLQETYLNKIKMIYIDPPYNTGKDFIYKDNFTVEKSEYEEASGQRDEDGGRLVANPDSNGRFHSDWLSMMYPRLKLARNLLSDDGFVAISIDDNEIANLTNLVDEIFGGGHRKIISVKMSEPTGVKMASVNKEGTLAKLKEYVVLIGKNPIKGLTPEKMPKQGWDYEYRSVLCGVTKEELISVKKILSNECRTTEDVAIVEELLSEIEIKNINTVSQEETGKDASKEWLFKNSWRIAQFSTLTGGAKDIAKKRKNNFNSSVPSFFAITTPKNKCYLIKGDFNDESNLPRCKVLLADDYLDVHIGDFWFDIKTTGLDNEGDVPFKNGKKPLKLLSRIFDMCISDNDIVMDFFSGSASSAQALISINQKNMTQNRYILVQIPEVINKQNKDQKDSYEFCVKNKLNPFITEIAKERIRRAGKKIKEDNADKEGIENLDIGFRVFKIDSSNMVNVHLSPDEAHPDMFAEQIDNIKKDRSSEDLLFQVLLDWGVDLSLPINREEIEGKQVFFVDDNALAACFDEDINEDFVKKLAEKQPLRVVFRDDGFTSDSVKINVEQIFKLKSPATDIKVI